jgi:hypothetical protein
VALGRFVDVDEIAAVHRSLHVRDFFRTLVDQQDDQVTSG